MSGFAVGRWRSDDPINRVVAPRLPAAPTTYDRQYQDQTANILRLYFNQLENALGQLVAGNPLDYLDFKTDVTYTPEIGRVGWNIPDQTLEVGMEYGVTQQIGLEQYARVQNNTGVLIPNGTVVGFTGAIPDSALSVAPYLANGATSSLYLVGVMTHDLPDTGQKGYCTVFGFVREVNTSAFALGDVLYASPTVAGAFTNVKPTAPNNVIPVAAVLQVGTTDGITTSPAAIDTAYALTFTNTDIANGITIGTPASRIVMGQAGLYLVALSVQVTSNNSSAKNIRVWLRKNGTTNIANSARLASIQINGGYVVISTSDTYSFLANDFIEVMYASDNTGISIATVAATAYAPAAPAVILAVTQTAQ